MLSQRTHYCIMSTSHGRAQKVGIYKTRDWIYRMLSVAVDIVEARLPYYHDGITLSIRTIIYRYKYLLYKNIIICIISYCKETSGMR